MSPVDETIIELSRMKLTLLMLGACTFVALGVWMFSSDASSIQLSRPFVNPTFIHGIGIVGIVFGGICGAFSFKKYFDKKPGLILNSVGITDNASGVSAGFVPWSEVIGAKIFEVQRQQMLVIAVRDPNKYIERGGLLKRGLNRANHTLCGSPIAIGSNALKIKFPELVTLFNQYRDKYGNA